MSDLMVAQRTSPSPQKETETESSKFESLIEVSLSEPHTSQSNSCHFPRPHPLRRGLYTLLVHVRKSPVFRGFVK